MRFYHRPTLSVSRFAAAPILTVSGEAEWGDNWDDALEEEGVVNQNEDDA